jgi:hypothetical protein
MAAAICRYGIQQVHTIRGAKSRHGGDNKTAAYLSRPPALLGPLLSAGGEAPSGSASPIAALLRLPRIGEG